MNIGVYFGCFIPLHIGHISMIERALAENEKVIIGICGFDDDRGLNFIPFKDRIKLINDIYGNNDKIILSVVDDKAIGLTGKFDEKSWQIWTEELFKNTGFSLTDNKNIYNWYTGETSYIEKLSKLYDPNIHKFHKVDRNLIPVSGTEIRKNPIKNVKYIDNHFVDFLKNNNKLYPSNVIFYEDKILPGKSIFLAGPTKRNGKIEDSWRNEAISILNDLGFDGNIFVPESKISDYKTLKENGFSTIDWEWAALNEASTIIFWIPRDMGDLIGLTTNIEFGRWTALTPDKVILGYPENAVKMDYIKKLYIETCKKNPCDNLNETIKEAIVNIERIIL